MGSDVVQSRPLFANDRVSWPPINLSYITHTYRLRELHRADKAYTRSLELDPTSATALTSLAMLQHMLGDVRRAIRLYHQALALGPQDPMATVLLEMALREQIDTLDPRTLPGLPGPLSEIDLDPFKVPKVSSVSPPTTPLLS